jgi:hypothetical protein
MWLQKNKHKKPKLNTLKEETLQMPQYQLMGKLKIDN